MFEVPPSTKKIEEVSLSQGLPGTLDATDGPAVDPVPAPVVSADDGMASPEDGLPLDEFARKCGQSEAEVWRRLRGGELIGRTQKGRLYVFEQEPQFDLIEEEAPKTPVAGHVERLDLRDLPPLPDASEAAAASNPTPGPTVRAGAYLALSGDKSSTPEMALLIDHLSLAKEENREILRLTQDSIRRVTELTDRIVEMKDQLIVAKETEVELLRRELAAEKTRARRLAQQNEDLEMLARTMAADKNSRY